MDDQTSADYQLGRLNTPELDEDTGKIINRPIANARQALEVYQRFEKMNQLRASRNKAIADAYNGTPPYNNEDLKAGSEEWRHNFSTYFLSTIVDMVSPKFVDLVNNMKYLTASKLPSSFPDADTKSEKFQERITDLIRNWDGWSDFIDRICTENTIFGYTASIQLNPNDWRPRPFRQEDVLFDQDAPQDSNRLDVFAVKVHYFIHEMLPFIEDENAKSESEEAGFNVKNIEHAIENAMPPKESLVYNPRQISDMVRNGSLYYSYHRDAKMISTVHVFVRNYEGGIDHWWVNTNPIDGNNEESGGEEINEDQDLPQVDDDSDGVLLQEEVNVVESMDDIINLFTFQSGNNKLFGSKGLGRMLYNFHIAIDRARNFFYDQIYLSGIIKGSMEEKDIIMSKAIVKFPFMILPPGFQVIEAQSPISTEAFQMMEQALMRQAQVIAGAFLPDQEAGDSPMQPQTATGENIDAQREQAIQEGISNRFWRQLTRAVTAMQKRICSKSNVKAAIRYANKKSSKVENSSAKILLGAQELALVKSVDPDWQETFDAAPQIGIADKEAVECILQLLDDGLSAAEIMVLSTQNAGQFTTSIGAQEDNKIINSYGMLAQNQYVNKTKLNDNLLRALLGTEKAKELFIPSPEQTTQTEQSRQQVLESLGMQGSAMAGSPVPIPVSQRDDHMQHFQAGQQLLAPQLSAMKMQADSQPLSIQQSALAGVSMQAGHLQQHIGAQLASGSTEQSIHQQMVSMREINQLIKEITGRYQKATIKAQQQAQQAAQQQAAKGPQSPAGPHPEMAVNPMTGQLPPGISGGMTTQPQPTPQQ